MELDEETRALLGFGAQADDLDYARYLATLAARRQSTRAAYESQHTTRAQRAARAKRNGKPVLHGYARIKAWRVANPGKFKKIQQRYLTSEKGKAMKSRKNAKYHAKRKQR